MRAAPSNDSDSVRIVRPSLSRYRHVAKVMAGLPVSAAIFNVSLIRITGVTEASDPVPATAEQSTPESAQDPYDVSITTPSGVWRRSSSRPNASYVSVVVRLFGSVSVLTRPNSPACVGVSRGGQLSQRHLRLYERADS